MAITYRYKQEGNWKYTGTGTPASNNITTVVDGDEFKNTTNGERWIVSGGSWTPILQKSLIKTLNGSSLYGSGDLAFSSLAGNILYVSSDGSDADTTRAGHVGNIFLPFKTLKAARDAAQVGDLIYVHPQTIVYDNRNSNSNYWNTRIADINLWKNGVTYYFSAGCEIQFHNSTVTGTNMALFNPNGTTIEECRVLGDLVFSTFSYGADTTNGYTYFYYDENLVGKTFFAKVHRFNNRSAEMLTIIRATATATATTKIDIYSDKDHVYASAGQTGGSSHMMIRGVDNGATADSMLEFNYNSEYRNYTSTTMAYPYYIRGNFSGSSISITGEKYVNVTGSSVMVLVNGSGSVIYDVKKTYYTTGLVGFGYLGSIINFNAFSNSNVIVKGDMFDNAANSYTTGIFYYLNASIGNTLSFQGNIYTNTSSGVGRFIVAHHANSRNNQTLIKGDIFYTGSGVTTQTMFSTNSFAGNPNKVKFIGNINGNFACAISNPYNGLVEVVGSTINSTVDGISSKLVANVGTNLGYFKLISSYVKLVNSLAEIINNNHLGIEIANSVVINSGNYTYGIVSTVNAGSGFLQLFGATLLFGGANAISFTGTMPLSSTASCTNKAVGVAGVISGDITINDNLSII